MGHDVTVYSVYYRIGQSTINITKTARLLMAIDQGKAEKLMGKQLSDIDIEGNNYLNCTLINQYFVIFLNFC